MNLEELVRLVLSQVLQALREKEEKKYRALVLFTGGKTKYQEALEEVKKLKAQGWSFIFACSESAEAIYGKELRESFPEIEFLTSPLNVSPLAVQEKMDLVLIPALSQNSVVKIALGLGDTLPTLLIKMALLLGKPILAAKNAADSRYFCQQRGLGNPSPALLEVMDGYLERLSSFGIRLVDVLALARTAEEMVEKKKEEEVVKSQPLNASPKRVITGEDVLAAVNKGEDLLYGPGYLLTPLARELASQHGVKLLQS